jgi:hypothetical protein
MANLGEFTRVLLDEGRIVLKGRPLPSEEERPAAARRLGVEFAIHRLDVAGPSIAFDAPSALVAAELVRQVSWFLVNRSEPSEMMERWLVPPKKPKTASEHLSADLMFRFLPQLHRRARSIAPGDRLASFLVEVLRAWPLSGVLSDVEEGPDGSVDLGGHPGLWMLYAERLARNEKRGWVPKGPARESVELVFQGLGKAKSGLLREAEGVSLG